VRAMVRLVWQRVLSVAVLGLAAPLLGPAGLRVHPAPAASPAGARVTTSRPATGTPAPASTAATTYYLALGDSLAAGVGAPAGEGYVDDVYQHELSRDPGLVLENLGCPGETTTTMIQGGICSYPQGSQLAAAESFLEAHRGQVALVTIDIGANNVDGCVPNGVVNLTCVLDGLAALQADMPEILDGLRAAGGDVPIYGVDYYDPFLAAWLEGPSGQQIARLSATLLTTLNGDLEQDYAAAGAPTADVQGAFASLDFATSGTYDGMTLPLNVANVCNWTHMCTSGDIHANATGHAVMAAAIDDLLDRAAAGGGRGDWLVGADGGVFALGTAGFYGSAAHLELAAPIVGMAASPDGYGYWLVGADGGVFTYGDARFYGSAAHEALGSPVVGIAPTPDGNGYWLVTAKGKVVGFGDAGNVPSLSLAHLNEPVVGAAVPLVPDGLALGAADGGVFALGGATFPGSLPGEHIELRAPVVGIAGN